MSFIKKSIIVPVSSKEAYEKFLGNFNDWWPKEYTWSQNVLKEIRIDGKKGGMCTEIGPDGFRCDWGRVTELSENERIGIKWQISPKREPVPDPAKASDLKIRFIAVNASETRLELEHLNFEHHGDGSEEYKAMMDSEYGWDYILNCFKQYF